MQYLFEKQNNGTYLYDISVIPVGDRCVGLEPLCADSNAHCVYDGGAGLKCKCRDPFTPANGTCIQGKTVVCKDIKRIS